jgi:sugar phosphate isomerase/epimerase
MIMNNKKTGLDRRRLLSLSAAGLGLMAVNPRILWAAPASSTHHLGVQLYTLREMMAKSVSETLKLVADIGYEEVEFAGYFGHTPKALREMLNGEGLSAPSGHILLEILQEDFEKALEGALILGHKFVVVPWLSEKQRGDSIDVYKKLAAQFNVWGEQCQKAGLRLAYHNHDFEFAEIDGQIPYDILLAETDPRYVSMELDLFWTVKAKQDPVEIFEAHPGRFPLWHLKDLDSQGQFADIGDGGIDFREIYKAAKVGGLEHGFVEHDSPTNAERTVRRGYAAMQKILGKGA